MKSKQIITSGILIFLTWANCLAESINTQFVYIGDAGHSAYKGAKQGLLEANLQGEFLNLKYTMTHLAAENHQVNKLDHYLAILVQAETSTLKEISQQYPNSPVFNLSVKDNTLRQQCLPNVLHTIPSNKMLADAETQLLKKNPDSLAKALAWHPGFNKFAARDLNKRFLKNQNQKMDSPAWAGWAAIKMSSDTVARKKITDPAVMLNYLKTELTFDGQKGSNMNFRETGQLRQLILLIENDKIVAEAPIRGVAKPPTLDSLGILTCTK